MIVTQQRVPGRSQELIKTYQCKIKDYKNAAPHARWRPFES